MPGGERMNRCGECANFIPTVIKRTARNGKCRLFYSSCTTENSRGCKNFSRKTITNADRIRAMSDEKMAKDLIPLIMEVCEDGIPCDEYMLDWLRQPAEGEQHESDY